MENENEQIQPDDELIEPEEVAEGEEDTTDWKALALKNQGIAKRLKTKLEKEKEAKIPASPEAKKPSDFDYGQKAFLKTYGISGADELTLVKTFVDRTGDEIDSLVNDEIFNAKLKSLRDAKAVKEAIPESTKRSSSGTSNKIDYWLTKPFNEVPPEFRREVLNAQLKNAEQKTKFG